MRLGKGAAALVALMGLAGTACEPSGAPAPGSPATPPPVSDLTCRAKDGKIGLAWGASAGAFAYRVSRSEAGGTPTVLGQATAEAYTDYAVTPGGAYQYTVTPLGVEAEGVASSPCNVTAPSNGGPDAPEGLACRAKDGKVDLSWNPVASAQTYRVFRAGAGQSRTQIAETPGQVHADIALQNGFQYAYDVEAVDGRGRVSPASAICQATPGPRPTGSAPPVVTDLACRGKNDKADLTFTPVAGAALYRVYRAEAGGTAAAIGETTGGVFATFGLQIGKAYEFSVESIGPGGAASARSAVCALTASGRITGPVNQPPRITSQPLTSALEEHVYYTTIAATDPEGGAITYSLVKAPTGMNLDPSSGLLRWIPVASLVGPQTVEVRAADPLGAFDTQAFVIDTAAFDRPPLIVSVPGRHARAGEAYRYDVEAFDPEGEPLSFGFAAPVPPGMSIDPATGLVSWTPQVADAGSPLIVVRAADPAGGFATQQFALEVAADRLDLLQPGGEIEVSPGEKVSLTLVANLPASFRVEPLPNNATLEGNRFEFTPDAGQVGDHDVGFLAVLGDQQDVNLVTFKVRKVNRPPVLGAPGAQQVREGESLVVPVSASDPDGDAVRLSAPGLSLENAVFDEVRQQLLFSPNFEQAGSYLVTISASDAQASVEAQIPIEVLDADPPSDVTDLVVDPVQSPTFAPKQSITGSIKGELRPGATSSTPFVVGLSPVSIRQGRRLTVEITGLRTAFAAGQVSADFGPGILVESVEVVSPTVARATIGAFPDAGTGIRTVRVSQPSGDAASLVAFSVEPGAATLSGVLLDSFTQQPLAGVRVAIQGLAGVSAVTDAQGRYAIDGVPAGTRTVVVAGPDYKVARFELAFSPNTPVDLGDSVALEALARPFSAGGLLPRAASAASVLDRGITQLEPDLSLDQLRAAVSDTLLAIGGPDVGVTDESGSQLNPEFLPPGMLNVQPAGLDFLAKRLSLGESYTLDEVLFLLTGSFGWALPSLTLESTLSQLQSMVNLAWAAPNHPNATQMIVIFNQGRSLDPNPPVLTPDTRVNAFQAHLLLMGFLSANFDGLNDAVDRLLIEQGKDPAAVLAQYGYDPQLYAGTNHGSGLWESLGSGGRLLARVGFDALFGSVAHAADPPGPQPPNTVQRPGITRRFTAGFSTLFDPQVIFAAVLAGVIAVAIAGALAMAGLFGGIAAFGVAAAAAAFGASFLSALLAKFVVAFVTADQDLSMVPDPVTEPNLGYEIANGQKKAKIQFRKSESEINRDLKVTTGATYLNEFQEVANVLSTSDVDPKFLDFRYHLWRIQPPLEGPLLQNANSRLVSTRSQPVAGNPELEQFVVTAGDLEEGNNYFVIVTVQFYRRLFGVDPDSKDLNVVYPDLGVKPSFTEQLPGNVANGLAGPSFNLWSKLLPLEFDVTGFQDFIDRKRAAAEQAAEQAREKIRTNGEAQAEKFRNEATAKSNAAETLRTDLEAKETRMKELRGQIEEVPQKPPLQVHQDWMDELEQYVQEATKSGKTEAEILADLRNPGTPIGSRTGALVASSGGQEAFEDVALRSWRAQVTDATRFSVNSSLTEVKAATSDLEKAIQQVEKSGGEVALKPAPNVPVVGDGSPRTVLDLVPAAELPPSVTPENLPAAKAALEEIKARGAELGTTNKSLAGSIGGQKTQLKKAIGESQKNVVAQPDIDQIQDLKKQLAIVEDEAKAIAQQQQLAKTEAEQLRKRAIAEVEAATAQAGGITTRQPSLPPKSAPDVQTKGRSFTVDNFKKLEGLDHVGPNARYKFKLGLGDVTGVVTDIGVEAFGGRNNVLVMRSTESAPIVVRKSGGDIQLPPPYAINAALQNGRETWSVASVEDLGAPLSEDATQREPGLRPALHPAAAPPPPTLLTDSGLPAGTDPLRWERRQEALRRHGLLPRGVQSIGSVGFPLSFETDQNPANVLGILHPTPPAGPTGKQGFLVRDFPFTAASPEVIDAGFPSDLIAVDGDGAVYLENMNSNQSFGGRIFRYYGNPLTREHVGSVAYYSLTLQYARPTLPVAMEISQGVSGDGLVEDLFIAELDPGLYIDPGIQPQNKILRLSTSSADTVPFYANGQNRNRLVAQPYATHPDFQMTGPSDMERDTVVRSGNAPLHLYFSDEENLFVISDVNRDGVGEVAKVLSIPGRRWSGIAIDTGGNLLVADYAAGEIFCIPTAELNAILTSGSPIGSNAELEQRGFLLKPDLDSPGDIEMDSWDERYLVSTPAGFKAFDVPLVGRLDANTLDAKVDIRGRELPITFRRERGNIFVVGAGSDGPLGKAVRMRVLRRDPVTGRTHWDERNYLNGLFGVSVLPGLL